MRCGGVLPMPWAAPLVAVVVMAIGWIHAPPRRWWQVAVPDGGRRSAARPPAGRSLAVLGDDRGQVGGREPQMLAEKRARDLPGGGPAAQPRLADTSSRRAMRPAAFCRGHLVHCWAFSCYPTPAARPDAAGRRRPAGGR